MNALDTVLAKNFISADDVETTIRLVADRLGMPDTAAMAAAEYRRLQAKNRSLKLALRFYARGDNWLWSDGYCPISADSGAKARLTLATLGGVK
jgi:hypothetical protein